MSVESNRPRVTLPLFCSGVGEADFNPRSAMWPRFLCRSTWTLMPMCRSFAK